jgi:hypothetical protein
MLACGPMSVPAPMEVVRAIRTPGLHVAGPSGTPAVQVAKLILGTTAAITGITAAIKNFPWLRFMNQLLCFDWDKFSKNIKNKREIPPESVKKMGLLNSTHSTNNLSGALEHLNLNYKLIYNENFVTLPFRYISERKRCNFIADSKKGKRERRQKFA